MKLKSMRAVLTAAVIIALIFSACGQGKNAAQDTNKSGSEKVTSIVASFYPMYIMTLNIAKDIPGVKVTNMADSQAGFHDYQLRPADVKLLEDADIFVTNGAGVERFIDKVVKQLPDLKLVEASKGIELLRDRNGELIPNVWVSPSGAISEARNIGEQLAALDPANAAKYKSNAQDYIKKLEAQRDKMLSALKDIKTRDIVTFHEAFPYLTNELGLNVVSVIERVPGEEPSAGELADIIKDVKAANVKVVFAEPQYPAKAAKIVARETEAGVYILDSIETGPKNSDADALIKAMDKNLEVLVQALK